MPKKDSLVIPSVIDIHCHPALKTWLFPTQHVYKKAYPKGLKFSEKMFVNIPSMQKGGVNAAVSVYYLPEAELKTDVLKKFFTKELFKLLQLIWKRKIERVLEDKSSNVAPFAQIKEYIEMFQREIDNAGNVAAIAKNFTEFKQLIAEGKTVFLNSIEGAHCLGNHDISYATLESNFLELYNNYSVCQFTLAHFYENIMVSSQGGIPPAIAKTINYSPANTYPNGYNENNDIAIKLVDKMLDAGVIIDLVHCTPGAKKMVYARNDLRNDKKRPLVFSHTGVRGVIEKYNKLNNYDMPEADLLYVPGDDDIKKIKDCGGVFGIIFMDYWLNGQESTDKAIDIVIETMEYIKNIPGSDGEKNYDHICIGSDLDGFTEVPKDLAGEKFIPGLIEAMRTALIPEIDIKKICFGNYMRVLEKGWGKQ